jgi:23S rRNA (guanosine2251-2'-O)-methyltransferase
MKVEGRNPVYEAIKANQILNFKIAREVIKEQKIQSIINLAKAYNVRFDLVNMVEIDRISETHHHQGVLAYIKSSPKKSLKMIIDEIKNDLCLLILEQVQDPHNLGAILRTAESTGTNAIIIPKRKNVGLTPAVHRASMGGSLYVPLLRENLFSTIKQLQKEGVRVIGVDPSGSTVYFNEILTGAVAFVLGGEDKGISSSLLGKCTNVVRIPMVGKIESLNISVSTAIILYERLRQKMYK